MPATRLDASRSMGTIRFYHEDPTKLKTSVGKIADSLASVGYKIEGPQFVGESDAHLIFRAHDGTYLGKVEIVAPTRAERMKQDAENKKSTFFVNVVASNYQTENIFAILGRRGFDFQDMPQGQLEQTLSNTAHGVTA